MVNKTAVKTTWRSLILMLIIAVLALLIIREMGERHFPVQAQTPPTRTVNTSTPIYQGVQTLLNKANPVAESLFYPMGDPHLALITRIQLAEAAKDSIDAQYYLFHDDEAGRSLLGALIDAARRGVTVRLLLDDMDVPGREGLFTQLAAELDTLEIRVFNPARIRSFRAIEFLARFPRVTRRMHNKSFTVDHAASVVGGRNIGNEYFDVNSEVAFTDFDVLAGGMIAQDVVTEFDTYWYSGLAYDVAQLGMQAESAAYQDWLQQVEGALLEYRRRIGAELESVTDKLMAADLVPYYDRGKVVFDQPAKVVSSLLDTNGHLAPEIMAMMRSAKEKLEITSPYFIPGKSGMEVFRDLRSRDVDVTILTNSLAANDVAAVHSGYMDYREELLALGVKLYELKAVNRDRSISFLGSKNASLHAKSFMVDDTLIYVGSFNLDPRSAIHNTEMGLVFNSPEYAEVANARLLPYFSKRAYQVILNDQGELEWLATNDEGQQQTFSKEPDTGLLQRIVVYLISWLPVEWLL